LREGKGVQRNPKEYDMGVRYSNEIPARSWSAEVRSAARRNGRHASYLTIQGRASAREAEAGSS